MHRPEADEYAPFYQTYVTRVPEGDVVEFLASQIEETTDLLARVTDEQARYRYAPGKWSVKEVVGHMADTERVMAYRALCFSRGEQAALPAFDENAYVAEAGFDRRSLGDLVDDFLAVRRATLRLFSGMDEPMTRRRGTASNRPITVRALAYIIAGHEVHHRSILRERYGLS